ncbi:twin-arginine translocase subunit TatC [Macrococcus equipercicus]|uniref:Sec-independent protein translocase protein TatC n=1 Tax=Macrococcus equipercicus TaxID=69967 RepID=A0A9Q9BPX1_9STAP|nr:twin-arginine translocase subunit TatC [Macrococcus equipercicus]KAA1036569.1 twin-arginine translocase subunit TatC [Macrococcus equipercicus]UTH13501.1 twin-arginine translocase subunit TatC [Macrococcus equipercicus]
MSKDDLTIIEHLEELRKRLMIIAYFLVGGVMVGFFFGKRVTKFLTKDDLPPEITLHYFKVTDPLTIYITVIMLIAIIIISPVILYQVWAFVSPGLHPKERKVTLSYIPVSIILFLIGLTFSYLIIFPYMIHFTIGLAADMGVNQLIGVREYFNELLKFTIPFGFVFQLPILLLFLTRLGIITPVILKKNRKYAYFALMVVAAIIAPPDVMTYVIFVLPMIVLYEVSIQISKIGYRQYLKAEQQLLQDELNND